MPKEDRRIIFDNEEVYKAVYALCMQKELPKPPAGVLTSISETTEGANMVVLYLENQQNSENPSTTVEYSRDFMAAALMLFCRGLGIPLPKNARKSVLIKDGVVMLRVQIG